MAESGDRCPGAELLESLAIGQKWTDDLRAHVSGCATCREAIERIEDDNGFLLGFATDVTVVENEQDELPRDFAVAGYQLVREIHRGGQGVVWLARQQSTKRLVAVKQMKHGPFATLADRARFEREIEVLASLSHPNIVAVHDAGSVAGHQYFVMDYVDGVSLGEAIRHFCPPTRDPAHAGRLEQAGDGDRPVDTRRREALSMFIKVCEAVHAAHVRGVIHRDLKPSNIQLDAGGEPHVLDFGLAKSTSSAREMTVTRSGQFVGSLPWAAPEQVEGSPSAIDLRTDVYSLGAILFQLLTGELPFGADRSLRDAIEDIVSRPAPRPSAVAARKGYPHVDGDLDTIVLKCLEKDRDRRYQTAGELALELRRHLAGEAIEARRDSAVYVLRKTLHRYRLRVAAATLLIVLIGVFGAVMAVLYRQSARLEHAATRSADSLSRLLAQSNVEQGRMAGMLGNMELAEQLLWGELLVHRDASGGARPTLNNPPGSPEAHWSLWELYRRFPCLSTIAFESDAVRAAAVADDGRSVWVAASNGDVRRLDSSGAVLDSYHIDLPAGHAVLMVSSSGQTVALYDGARCRVWRRGDVKGSVGEFPPAGDTAAEIRLSSSGQRLVAIVQGEALVFDVDSPSPVARFAASGSALVAAALSNDDRKVAARDERGDLYLWDIATADSLATVHVANPPREDLHPIGELLFSRDDTIVADAWIDIPGRIWDVRASPPEVIDLAVAPGDYRVQAFSPDGRRLAVSDLGGAIHLFDTSTGERLTTFVADTSRIRSLLFSGDSRSLWTCSDERLRLWEIEAGCHVRTVTVPNEALHCVTFDSIRGQLVAGGGSGELYRIDVANLSLTAARFGNESTVSSVASSPNGQQLAAATYANAVYVWDQEASPPSVRMTPHPNRVSNVTYSPDGELFATACDDGYVRVWRADSLDVVRTFATGDRVPQIAFDPEGKFLAAAVRDGSLHVMDVQTGADSIWAKEIGTPLRAVRYSPDGHWLYAAGADREVGVWDVVHGQRVATLEGHSQEIYALDVSPDGELIASGDTGGTIRLWHAALRRPLLTLDGHSRAVMSLEFASDGRRLASASLDGTVRLWDLDYYKRHVAGNLEAQLHNLGIGTLDPSRLDQWRKWASETLSDQPSR